MLETSFQLTARALAAMVLITCSATLASAQLQSPDQIACINALAKAETKLAKTQGKDVGKCMKSFAAGKLAACQTAEGCLTADVKGKVAKAAAKLSSASARFCAADSPDYGSVDEPEATRRIRFLTNALNADIFGAALDTTLATRTGDSDVAKCQGKAAKVVQKLFDTRMSGYTKCKSAGLDDGSIVDTTGLAACLSDVSSTESKVVKALEKLDSTLTKSCAEVATGTAFPGRCAAVPDAGVCIQAQSRCRFCMLINDLDGLSADCDLYDDTVANDSCTEGDGRCNGSSLLCDRAFDAVSYPTSHNAFTNADEGWAVPNQKHGIARQLKDGVRGLMLDTYNFEGTPHLCHASCDLNEGAKWREPLVDGLIRVRDFLEDNPGEVVSFIFEAYISEADTAVAMAAAGLDAYVHEQAVGAPWPTLQQLIDSGKRLVVFTDDSAAALPWHLYVWDFAWETNFSFAAIEDFTCGINRGSMANSLFILNHFLTGPFGGSDTLAGRANLSSVFQPRAEQCQSESGRLPNFVTVDFVNIGALYEVVESLNDIGTCKP
jgi:hypothetical protein